MSKCEDCGLKTQALFNNFNDKKFRCVSCSMKKFDETAAKLAPKIKTKSGSDEDPSN